jgi:hypothetical protein
VVSQHLPEIGRKMGRDRFVDLAETLLLRVITETASGNVTLKEAAGRALGLFPFLKQIATGKLGREKQYVFAIECWGRQGAEYKRDGYICEGPEVLGKCIEWLARGGWPNVRIINLTNILSETHMGWVIATLGPELAEARLKQEMEEGDENAAFTWELFDEMRRRLDRSGERRGEAPANAHWQKWTPPEADAPIAA